MNTKIIRPGLRSVVFMVVLGSALWGCASTSKQTPAADPALTALESDRAELRAEKRALINEAMMLDSSQRTPFWAEYDQYEAELKNYYDEKYLLMLDYARNYSRMSDDIAANLAERAFKLQQMRLDITRKYFDGFSKATSPTIAARFLQLENQINLLSDIQISSEMPLIPMPHEDKLKAKR